MLRLVLGYWAVPNTCLRSINISGFVLPLFVEVRNTITVIYPFLSHRPGNILWLDKWIIIVNKLAFLVLGGAIASISDCELINEFLLLFFELLNFFFYSILLLDHIAHHPLIFWVKWVYCNFFVLENTAMMLDKVSMLLNGLFVNRIGWFGVKNVHHQTKIVLVDTLFFQLLVDCLVTS